MKSSLIQLVFNSLQTWSRKQSPSNRFRVRGMCLIERSIFWTGIHLTLNDSSMEATRSLNFFSRPTIASSSLPGSKFNCFVSDADTVVDDVVVTGTMADEVDGAEVMATVS